MYGKSCFPDTILFPSLSCLFGEAKPVVEPKACTCGGVEKFWMASWKTDFASCLDATLTLFRISIQTYPWQNSEKGAFIEFWSSLRWPIVLSAAGPEPQFKMEGVRYGTWNSSPPFTCEWGWKNSTKRAGNQISYTSIFLFLVLCQPLKSYIFTFHKKCPRTNPLYRKQTTWLLCYAPTRTGLFFLFFHSSKT